MKKKKSFTDDFDNERNGKYDRRKYYKFTSYDKSMV